jgi:hypothetical protein
MNAIQIQELINKIGEFNPNLNLQYFCDKNQEILISEFEKIEELGSELNQKLVVQLRENSDAELLQKFIDTINKNGKNLEEYYHKFRIKLSESNKSEIINIKSIPNVCSLIDKKLEYLTNLKIDLQNKIIFLGYRVNSDFENSPHSSVFNQNKEYLITERATFNLSKKESLMLLYVLEEVSLLKFENNTHKINFIEQNFNFTEVRKTEFFGKPFPMKGTNSEYSKFRSDDKNEIISNNKTLETLIKKFKAIGDSFEFKKK